MCGIVGYVGKKRVVPVIIDGLRRLEYRGYDSAGIAVAVSEDLRNKALDTLFGKEEEFDYTSTTTNNSPPSAPKTEDAPAGAADAGAAAAPRGHEHQPGRLRL